MPFQSRIKTFFTFFLDKSLKHDTLFISTKQNNNGEQLETATTPILTATKTFFTFFLDKSIITRYIIYIRDNHRH